MSQLSKGMYGHELRPTSNLFGLQCGQIRGHDFVHNGGWYNRRGEKLGWGDLSDVDFRRISEELTEDELFFVLFEQDAFWNFVTCVGRLGSDARVKQDEEAPGIAYVAEKCGYIITRGACYIVKDSPSYKACKIGGLTLQELTREQAVVLLTAN